MVAFVNNLASNSITDSQRWIWVYQRQVYILELNYLNKMDQITDEIMDRISVQKLQIVTITDKQDQDQVMDQIIEKITD